MSDEDRFKIDEERLDSIIEDLEKTEEFLEGVTDDIERSVRQLQEVWEGLAAQAQQAAQEEWNDGMRDMRTALAGLRGAARIAHGNYTAAAQANSDMWELS